MKATSPDNYFAATVRVGESATVKSPTNVEASEAIKRFSGYVYACVDRKASIVAGVPYMVYRAKRRRGKSVGLKKLQWLRNPMLGKSSIYANAADDVEAVPDHPLLELLQKPNAHQSGSEFAHLDAAFLEATGNSYMHVVTDRGGVPMELWPLYPQVTRVIPDVDGLVKGYLYGREPTHAQVFTPDEVSHARLANLFNPYYGLAPVQAVFGEVDVYNAGTQYELALIDNQARPDFLIRLKSTTIPKDVQERLREQLNARHRGVRNRGNFAILSGDPEITPLQWNPKDLAWIEQQKWSRDTIAAAFGVPISMLTVESVNLANAESGMRQFMRVSIMPRLCVLADRLTNDILPMYGSKPGEYWVAHENPVPEDQLFVRDTNVQYVNAGIRTINEARQIEGAEEIDGGDTLRVAGQPVAMTFEDTLPPQPMLPAPVEESDDANAAQPYDPARSSAILDVLGRVSSGTLASEAAVLFLVGQVGMDDATARRMVDAQAEIVPEPEEPEEEAKDEAADDEEQPAVKALSLAGMWSKEALCPCCKDAPEAPPPSDEYSEGTPVGEPEGTLPGHPEPPSRFVKELRAFFDDQREAALAAMGGEKSLATKGVEDLLRDWNLAAAEWDEKLLAATRQSLEGIATRGAKSAVEELVGLLGSKPAPPDIAFDLEDPHYVNAFDTETARYIRSVNDETEKQIRAALKAGVESGETIQQLKDRIKAVFGFTDDRAKTIARTETARFNGMGRMEQMRQSGVPMKKRWLLAGGACSLCRQLAEKGDIPLDAAFFQIGETVYGDDGQVYENDYAPVLTAPAHPNDRCMCVFVVDEAYLEGA